MTAVTAPNHLEHTLQLSHLVSVHADTKTGPPPARRGLNAGNTNPQCQAPHCNPFQPFCFQGEPLLQDLEEAEVCGGPHAHDCHSRHHRAALSALWRCSPSVQVSQAYLQSPPLPCPPLPSPALPCPPLPSLVLPLLSSPCLSSSCLSLS